MSTPHGGRLVNRVLPKKNSEKIQQQINELPEISVSSELAYDIENIAKGVFSPLEGFIGEQDYINILSDKRLSNDLPWTIPMLLDISNEEAEKLKENDDILLTSNSRPIAIIHLEEKYRYSRNQLCTQVYGTKDPKHPGVAKVLGMKELLISGKINLIEEPPSKFSRYKLTPMETRILFKEKGWKTVVGFQTRNAPHLGHEYVQKTALTFVDGIFINPIIGKKKQGDFKDELTLETYKTLIENYYLKEVAVLAILQTEMRYAGPREAIFHAIVRKNFGCTHFIVGRDHAGVGNYYPSYAAQEIFNEFPDLGVIPLFFKSFFYCRKCGGVANEKTCPHGKQFHVEFKGTMIREMLERGSAQPEVMRPEVADIILKWKKPFVE